VKLDLVELRNRYEGDNIEISMCSRQNIF